MVRLFGHKTHARRNDMGEVRLKPHDITLNPDIRLLKEALLVYPTDAKMQAIKSQKFPSKKFF